MLRSALAALLALTLAAPAVLAQADTLLVSPEAPLAPADTLRQPGLPADTLAAEPGLVADTMRQPGPAPRRPIIALRGPRRGAGLTGVPPRQPVHTTPALLAPVPGAFVYDLAVTGAPAGVALGLTPPHRLALTLDGRPADDLFTGRPALERLPADILAPLHADPLRRGAPAGLAADSRAFGADVPITELRYRAGPDGHQLVSATHAQTRRPAFVQRLGGDAARMTSVFHISGHGADGESPNAGVNGFQLIARTGVALPGLAAGITQRHLRRTERTWGGVDPQAPNYFVRTAPVVDPLAQRTVVQNDLSLDIQIPLLTEAPLAASAYWTVASLRHDGGIPTSARGDRVGIVLEQPLTLGAHRVRLAADAHLGRIWWSTALPDDALAPELHLTATDSVAFAGVHVVLQGGFHAAGGESFPSGRLEAARSFGALHVAAAAFASGARLAPAERFGWGELTPSEAVGAERSLGASFAIATRLGPATAALTAEVRRDTDPRLLVMDTATDARFISASGALERALLTARLAFREDEPRGPYGHVWAAAQRVVSDDGSSLLRREAEALPEAWGHARIGWRFAALFDGETDLDLFARGRAWSAFRSRVPHRPTGLMALPAPDAPTVGASGALDLVAQAALGRGRATVFVSYENALAGVAYPGTFVVPVYPLATPALRIGIFWVLAN